MVTGHLGTFAFTTTALSLPLVEIEPSEETIAAIQGGYLGLAKGSGVPYEPGELVEGGEYKLTFEDNNNTHIVDTDSASSGTGVVKAIRKSQTCTWTKPAPSGLTNGATRVFTGFVTGHKESTQKTGDRSLIMLTVKVASTITKSPAS